MIDNLVMMACPAVACITSPDGGHECGQVSQQHAKPRSDSEETYRGVSAPKRKRVEEVPTEIGEMPKVNPACPLQEISGSRWLAQVVEACRQLSADPGAT